MIRDLLSKILPWLIALFTGSKSPARIQAGQTSKVSRNRADGTKLMGTMLENQCIPSRFLMGGRGYFNIYLPQYEAGRRYPVLYLFHGMGDDHTRWESKGEMSRIIDAAWAAGGIGPFITVTPGAHLSFYIDGLDFFDGEPGHKFQSFFEQELRPYIEANFPVLTGRENTAIAGISMGGYGALRYAVLHPEDYCLCYSMSGASEGLDWTHLTDNVPAIADIVATKYPDADYSQLPELYLECGKMDPMVGHHNKVTHRRFMAMGVPHHFSLHPGTHNWSYWQGSFGRLLSVLFAPAKD